MIVQQPKAEQPTQKPTQVSKTIQTIQERKEDPNLSQTKIQSVLVSPKKQPTRLTQHTLSGPQISPSTSPKKDRNEQRNDVQGTKEFLKDIREEDLKERDKRIESLKETNGKLAIRSFLTSIELMRRDSLPPPQPQVITQTEARVDPILTSHSLPKYYVQPTIKNKSVHTSSVSIQTDPVTTKIEKPVSKDNSEELEQLKKENRDLKDIIINRIRTNSNPQQSHDLSGLRAEIAGLRRQIEEYEAMASHPIQEETSNSGLRDLQRALDENREELKKVKEYWNKDKAIIRDMSHDLEKALNEVENSKVSALAQQRIHDAEKSELLSKLTKKDIARKELEQINGELDRLRRENEKLENTRTRQNEDLIVQNQKLKQDLQKARDELEAMRRVFAEDQKKQKPLQSRGNSTPKKATRVSPIDVYDKAELAGSSSGPINQLLFENMLLGIEVCRLQFAYTGCRCGKTEKAPTDPTKPDLLDESPFINRADNRDYTAKKVLQPIVQPSATDDKSQLAVVTKERDSLKVLLADYQRKLLEARRAIDAMRAEKGERENLPLNNLPSSAKQESCSDSTCKSKKALRELELQNKILTAENSKLTSLLGSMKQSRVA